MNFNIGDIVWCIETGVRGEIIKLYRPTGAEEQVMIETDDNRGQYHAPKSLWRLYEPESESLATCNQANSSVLGIATNTYQDLHNNYVIKFASNHGISISDAMNQPMVKAHEEYCRYIQENGGLMRG